ncbi:MAG TPA: hypothetical protein PLM07_03175 [Candidatus Rifleibacterium sp.]|nr:hypothetical protein [Candidatus Rifleibacterium sp.]HPT44888.1 hypothetical protein [Candidatus Rifleibacterium sp.]
MKKRLTALFLALVALVTTGCIQESLVIPVATVTGKVVVPAGKTSTGIKVTVAGESSMYAYVDDSGDYSLEFRKNGRFLLIARGKDFDINFAWVDAISEKSVTAPDITLREKLVGEAIWMVSIIDFPDAVSFNIKSISPAWSTASEKMFDDGTHGDVLANDGIFTLRLNNLKTGNQQYSIEYAKNDGKTTTAGDPHKETTVNGNSTLYIPESTLKLARGKVTSDLVGVNYNEVILATRKGSRSMKLDSDGSYSFSMEGNGREYLVFRGKNFHARAIPVDLSTLTLLEVPTTTISSKKSGEVKMILIASDFSEVKDPTVVGDFTNWQPQKLYDDATNGDEVLGDGVYTRVFKNVNTTNVYQKYAFNITATNQVKDPYQESEDGTYSVIQVKF